MVGRGADILAGTDETERVGAALERRPAKDVILGDVEFGVPGVDDRAASDVCAWFVFEISGSGEGLTVQQDGVDAVIRTVGDLRQEFIAPVCWHVERDVDA